MNLQHCACLTVCVANVAAYAGVSHCTFRCGQARSVQWLTPAYAATLAIQTVRHALCWRFTALSDVARRALCNGSLQRMLQHWPYRQSGTHNVGGSLHFLSFRRCQACSMQRLITAYDATLAVQSPACCCLRPTAVQGPVSWRPTTFK